MGPTGNQRAESVRRKASRRDCLHHGGGDPEDAVVQDSVTVDKEICGHCNYKCEDTGKGDDGLLCDYCGYWVHASCEGMSKESYKMFVKLASEVPNLSYYCELNHCKRVSSEILKHIGPIRKKSGCKFLEN